MIMIVPSVEECSHWVCRDTKSSTSIVSYNKVYLVCFDEQTEEYYIQNKGHNIFSFECVFKGSFLKLSA